MPQFMNLTCVGGMAQNYPIPLPGYAASGVASITNPGASRQQVRSTFGADLPPILDLTSFLSGALPAALAPGQSFQTPLAPSCGAPHVACSITSSQLGTLVLNRYLDPLGTILAGSSTQAMTAGVAAVLDASASSIFQAFSLNIQNTSASGCTLSSFSAVLANH